MTQVEFEGEVSIKGGCRLTENGVEIYDVAKGEWEPITSAYEWVNKRTRPAKPNNKTMKYKIKTDLLHGYDLNEQISEGEKEALLKEGCSESWFEPVEEVQEGKYYLFEGCVFSYIIRCNGEYDEGNIYGQSYPLVDASYANFEEESRGVRHHLEGEATTDQVREALIKEAKRRGFEDGKQIISWVEGSDELVTIGGNEGFRYEEHSDQLSLGHTWIYKQGEFAQVVDQTPTIEINGYEVEFNDHPKVGCTTIKKKVFIEQAKTIARHGVRIYRKGEDITDQILAIASHYGYEDEIKYRAGDTIIMGTLEDVTFSDQNMWSNND